MKMKAKSNMKIRIMFVFTIIFLCVLGKVNTTIEASEVEYQTPILIVFDSTIEEHEHFKNIFDSVSLDYDEVKLKSLDINSISKYNAIVIPYEIINKMSNSTIEEIIHLVNQEGLNIVIEGKTKLSEKLGVEYSGKKTIVSKLRDLKHEEIELTLQYPLEIDDFRKPSDFNGMYVYPTKQQFMTTFQFGEGRVIYLPTHVGYDDCEGYKIYPYLHEYICEYFDVEISLERASLIAYVDWGYYYDKDPFVIAEQFKEQGINEVHVSGWYDVNDYYVFMDKFIDACHTNGILVYAWLEYPMITAEFFEKYPEYREKSVMGTHHSVTWRKLVALDIPECQRAVKQHAIDFINRYEFDGIDFAELYYELPIGDEKVSFEFDKEGLTEGEIRFLGFYTPMNDYFRKIYKEKMGYDPILVFKPESKYFFKDNNLKYFNEFIGYRRQLLKDINEEFISFFQNDKYFSEGLDIIVTQIDSIFDETILSETGVHVDDFVDLQNKYEFTFMVEDPFSLWSQGPSRYPKISKEYVHRMSEYDKFFIDINVVHRYDTIYPHNKQTGLEFTMLISEASKSASKVCIYSEQTPYRFDYNYVKNSMASMVEIKNMGEYMYFNSFQEFEYITEKNGYAVYVDDKLWPGITDNGIMLNSGEHEVEFKDSRREDFFMRDINVDFKTLEYFDDGIHLERDGDQNMFVTLNKKPEMVIADGKEVKVETFYTKGNYILYFNFEAEDIYIYENGMDKSKISVFINGKECIFDSEIEIIGERCFLPASEMLEIIGAEYEIHKEFDDPTIFGSYNGYVFWMQANNKSARENGNDLEMDVNPYYLYNQDKLMLPLRYVFESLNFNVEWKAQDYMVLIK